MSDPLNIFQPSAPQAEIGVLGCCLLDPVLCISDTQEAVPNEEAFFDVRNQLIYNHLLAMFNTRKPIDLITLQSRLKDAGQLDGIGGLTYLNMLMDQTPSAANLPSYLADVREKYLLRRMLALTTEIRGKILGGGLDVNELLDESERDLMALNSERVVSHEVHIRTALLKVQDRLDQMQRGEALTEGIPMQVDPYLDKMTLGLGPGDMFVLAGRPGDGKTSFAMQVCGNVAINQNLPVLVFSLEMKQVQLAARLLYERIGGDFQRYRTGYMENTDYIKIVETMPKLCGAPLWLDDTPRQTMLQIRARARRMHAKHGLALVMIDYIQLLKGNKNYRERRDQLADISEDVKTLAMELNIPILALAQMNREVEKGEKWRKPRLSDLRECGNLEQDADVVGMLFQPAPPKEKEEKGKKPEDWSKHSRRLNILIAKARNGPTGVCNMLFQKSSMRFSPFVEAKTREPEDYHQEEM